MGSIITLGINKMEIDRGKNYTFNNHSKNKILQVITKISCFLCLYFPKNMV